jgi:hypothetical protein
MSEAFDGGGSPLEKAKPSDALTDFDRRVYESLRKVLWIPDDFKEYMTQYNALNQPPIPIGQIFGFTQFTGQIATIATTESTTSATEVDLTTPGPTLTGLPGGRYVFLWGAAARNTTGGAVARMHLIVNGGAPQGTAQAGSVSEFFSVMSFSVEDLPDGDNTVTTKYSQSGGGTASFQDRNLFSLRIANS